MNQITQLPFVHVPVGSFLVRCVDPAGLPTHDWILVDSGEASQVPRLLKAIDGLLSHEEDRVRYVCLTHGHLDHTAATPAVLERFPGCQVVLHPEEIPFVCEGKPFGSCPGDTWAFKLLKRFSHEATVRVPRERVLPLKDGERWEYEHIIRLVETPGHTPGSASYLHVPSRSLLVGDAVMNIVGPMAKRPGISGPMAMSTCHWGDAMKAITKITQLHEQVDNVFPAHDYSPKGVHISKIQSFHPSAPKSGTS
ncbi:Metallo-hydrolase/oxidoreductase [Basidiobolus meristosporus CBS 931.73]|uniref:Metallo-hydrolase/oxidoreductase n=1 Tax=Basidiobolus meristosporus CBS 931.73 TaxID=1314790 RepID=A0A1Y1YIC5_9FUNG|nr:Metallo-hydrolase/oxidoreductase [Basidiobolus meristosporus CBS 931.73]|eukprot:ORX97466.1 Metallo-hydrolase/oxidoreductase [Basidiobolus meristosporus CBS 931.73]